MSRYLRKNVLFQGANRVYHQLYRGCFWGCFWVFLGFIRSSGDSLIICIITSWIQFHMCLCIISCSRSKLFQDFSSRVRGIRISFLSSTSIFPLWFPFMKRHTLHSFNTCSHSCCHLRRYTFSELPLYQPGTTIGYSQFYINYFI